MADLRIIDTLRRLFPPVQKGPPYPQLQSASRAPNRLGPYAIPPLLPFDVFAITAYLLELSGAYHHISPLPMGPMGEDGRPRSATADGGPALRCIEVTQAETETCRAAAQAWRAKPDWADKAGQQKWLRQSFSEVTSLWTELFGVHGRQPVFQPLQPHSAAPDWWRIAHQLLMIADEACEGVGFTPPDTDEITHENRPWFDDVLVMIAMEEFTDTTWYGVKSLSSADPNVACVLPKCRTTPVGCTLRSLSHHLALLPPQGITRARWYPPPPGDMPLDDTQLNVLLVPFPFEIPHTAFSGSASRADLRGNWGNFRLKQTWLPDRDHPVKTRAFVQRLENFIGQLADVATKDYSARNIHVVVLPECSINSAIYAELVPRLKERLPELELLIAGIADYAGRDGNFVAVTQYSVRPKETDGPTDGDFTDPLTVVREKHHRWKLDKGQLDSYALTGALNPNFDWWEDIGLLSRRVDFTAFRRKSVLAAMICEDLARVDPCQELLRSIGPNLVVALLMDGPQLPHRWPGRYATVLAEDPGCAVLTLTSKALMQRQHDFGQPKSEGPADRVIALWRDDKNRKNVPIECPDGYHGVCLTLWSTQAMDTTIDGRIDDSGKAWIYGAHTALKLTKPPSLRS